MTPLQRPLRAPARHGRNSLERVLGELANKTLDLKHAHDVIAAKDRRIEQLERQVDGLTRGAHP